MDYNHIIAISLHGLSGVFWAGTSFALARIGANGERLFAPQMTAALIAMASGVYLWAMTHAGAFGPSEQVLVAGIASAVVAAIVQLAIGGPAVRRLRANPAAGQDTARARFSLAQRAGAAMLAVTVTCMVVARYVW